MMAPPEIKLRREKLTTNQETVAVKFRLNRMRTLDCCSIKLVVIKD